MGSPAAHHTDDGRADDGRADDGHADDECRADGCRAEPCRTEFRLRWVSCCFAISSWALCSCFRRSAAAVLRCWPSRCKRWRLCAVWGSIRRFTALASSFPPATGVAFASAAALESGRRWACALACLRSCSSLSASARRCVSTAVLARTCSATSLLACAWSSWR